MGMQIPNELVNLFHGLTGTRWPDVDEDRLRDLSDMYETVQHILDTELPELVIVLRRKVGSTFDSRTTAYFERSLAQFTAGGRDYLGEAARLAEEIRVYARQAANQVEYAKWMIIGQLIQLALEIAWAVAMSYWTFGASLSWISVFRFIRQTMIRNILDWLVRNLLSHLFIAQLFGVTMDLLIQRIQMDQGNRDEWDKELTRMAAAGAFVEGLLSAGLSLGTDLLLAGRLSKSLGDSIGDASADTAAPPPRSLTRDPPPDPSTPPRDVPDPPASPPPRADDPPSTDRPGSVDPPGDGDMTPRFGRDLSHLFSRNSSAFLTPAQIPGGGWRSSGAGLRFLDEAATTFERHLGSVLGGRAARDLGRDYADTLLRRWDTPGLDSALDDLLSPLPLPRATRDHLAHDVPAALARTVREFGTGWRDRLLDLGLGAASGAVEGYVGEGLTNLLFSPEGEWKASGMSAVAGATTSVVQQLSTMGLVGAIDGLRDLDIAPPDTDAPAAGPAPAAEGGPTRTEGGPAPDDGSAPSETASGNGTPRTPTPDGAPDPRPASTGDGPPPVRGGGAAGAEGRAPNGTGVRGLTDLFHAELRTGTGSPATADVPRTAPPTATPVPPPVAVNVPDTHSVGADRSQPSASTAPEDVPLPTSRPGTPVSEDTPSSATHAATTVDGDTGAGPGDGAPPPPRTDSRTARDGSLPAPTGSSGSVGTDPLPRDIPLPPSRPATPVPGETAPSPRSGDGSGQRQGATNPPPRTGPQPERGEPNRDDTAAAHGPADTPDTDEAPAGPLPQDVPLPPSRPRTPSPVPTQAENDGTSTHDRADTPPDPEDVPLPPSRPHTPDPTTPPENIPLPPSRPHTPDPTTPPENIPLPPSRPHTPDPTTSDEEPGVRLNYLITTGWIESYGVRVDPDAVLSSVRPALPDDVRDRFRERLTRDVRPFFRPGGVRIEGADGRSHQLRLSSADDWRPSTTTGDGPARAKFKGLDDIQEQSGVSASDTSGAVRRFGIQFSGHLLATGGTVPLPSLRANLGVGSSSWQHSGDTGEVQLRTTEMTGRGVDYSADLRVVSGTDGADGTPGAVRRGVELTLMGGLALRRDDLPDTITFPDPLAPRPQRTPAPTRVGGYLSNSHPIFAEEVVRDGDAPAGTRPADQGIAEWIADRLGLSAPTGRPRPNLLRRLYTPGESVLRTPWAERRRARDRDAVTGLFRSESLVNHLPVFTGEAAVLGFHDSEGRPRAVTVWSYPLRMTRVPDIPASFNIKHTDRFARSSTSTAHRNSGFSVRPGIGVMERLPGDAVRLEMPIVEYQYGRDTGNSRARQSAAWNARLFHSTDTAVYSIRRRVAVWVDGDTAPTLFDLTSVEALTSHEALVLNDPSANAPLPDAPAPRDPFLGRPRPTHLGDSQVRAVTFPDGAEVRLDRGNRPVTVFGEYAHRLLRRIDARYPGLVLPHMAVPGSSPPDRSHAGWNHRRNRDTAVANTLRVLNAVNLRSFRFRNGDWIGHGMEVRLTETKLLPWGNEAGEHRITVPDHISLWLTASVRTPVPGPQVSGAHTGSTSGASTGLRRRDNTSRTHAVELRASATWRGVNTVDSGDVPLFSGGGGGRLTGEHRSLDQHGSGRSVTAEDNVKDKSGTQQLFADVEFGAWIGPGDTLLPRSARIDRPEPRTSRDLFADGRDRVRGRVELHAPRPVRPVPLDPAPTRPPGAFRRLSAAHARDVFRAGAPMLLTDAGTGSGRTGEDAEGPPTIERTRAAEVLTNTFHVVQVFDTTVDRDGDRPTNVLSHTFDELNRTLRDLPGRLASQTGAGEVLAHHMSPQQLAATPALMSGSGSRLRFQTDQTLPPTRNRLTVATWYLPTRVESLTPRKSAAVESSHTKESAIGTARVSTRGLFLGVFGRSGLNTNTGAPPGEAPPPTAVDPIIGPGAEARYRLLGRGDTTSATQSLRSRTEVKLAGPSLEFVTDGVVVQAFEHKHDLSLGLTIPRSPGESDHAAWLAPVARAQKGVVPALWAYMEGLVKDRVDWAPDGTPTVGSHAPPAAPRAPVRPMDGLADKGYQSRPLDPGEALDDLIAALSNGGYELTRTSREDLLHQLSTHMSRDLDGVPPMRVRVNPTSTVHRDTGSDGSSTHPRGFSRTATLNISVRRGATRTRQFGGMMEFVERVVVVRSADRGTLEMSGWSFSGLVGARAPIAGGTGSSAALRAGGDVVVRHQSGVEESDSESVSVERTYERVGFGPYAVVSTETTLTLTVEVGERTYTGTGRSGTVETVQPVPYLTVGDATGATAAPPPTPVAVPTDGGTDAGTAPPEDGGTDATGDAPEADGAAGPGDGAAAADPVTAWAERHASRGYTPLRGEGGTDAPVAVQGAGRGVFDAAVESAARDRGWRPEDGGRSAREYLDDAAGRDTGTNPISTVASELVLRGLAPEALRHADGVQLSDVRGTAVNLRALVDPGRAALVSVSGESRARDAEHEQHGSSSSRSESGANALDATAQVLTTGRPDDRLRESPAGADLASNARSGQGRSSSGRTGAVATGPGTSRQFLVRVPAVWLAWSGPAGSPATRRHPVEVEASLTLWISETRAREWDLATDSPEINRLSSAEAAFTQADAAYLDARLPLLELVGTLDEAGADLRDRYGAQVRVLERAAAERERALRELEQALAAARGRTWPPGRTSADPAGGLSRQDRLIRDFAQNLTAP